MLAEYEAYARNALVQLRRIREGTQIEEDHMRNRQLIVHWLLANTARARDGASATARRTTVMDRPSVPRRRGPAARRSAAHQGRRRLPGRQELLETYGVHFDPELRDEVVARVDASRPGVVHAFVMPEL